MDETVQLSEPVQSDILSNIDALFLDSCYPGLVAEIGSRTNTSFHERYIDTNPPCQGGSVVAKANQPTTITNQRQGFNETTKISQNPEVRKQ